MPWVWMDDIPVNPYAPVKYYVRKPNEKARGQKVDLKRALEFQGLPLGEQIEKLLSILAEAISEGYSGIDLYGLALELGVPRKYLVELARKYINGNGAVKLARSRYLKPVGLKYVPPHDREGDKVVREHISNLYGR